MKLVIIILIAGLMQVSAASFGQKVSLSEKNATLSNIFQKMRAQTGYDFLFDAEVMRSTKRVNVSFKNVPLAEALEKCLEGQDLEFTIEAQSVIVRKKEKSFLDKVKDVTLDLFQGQAIDVRGKVVDSLGNGLPGATVSVKGTNRSTQTTQNGEFFIKNVDEGAVFVVTYLGYVTKEQPVYKDYNFIRLVESTSKLDEVQIQAYGITSRRLNTGNISTVKAKDIENDVISDPMLALRGKIAGLAIAQTSGVSGSEVKINIRGLNSFTNGTQPLVLVDGVPFDPNVTGLTNTGRGAGSTISAFTFINPSDIESIDVLKDSDATAIYGSRGANGVILITTKRGKSGSAVVDLKIQHGIGEVAKHRDFMNTQEYLEMRREAFSNDGLVPSDDPLESRSGNRYAPDLTLWDQNQYTDWQKEFLGHSSYSNVQGTITGGSTNYNYLISGNFNKETSVFPGSSNFQTGRIRFSLSNTSNNGKFRSMLSGGFSTDKSLLPTSDFSKYLNLPPNAPNPFNEDGTLNWALNPITGSTTWPGGLNPYTKVFSETIENRNKNLIGNVELSYNLIPELEVKVSAGLNNVNGDSFRSELIEGFEPLFRSFATAGATFGNIRNTSWQVEPLLSYKRKIGRNDLSLILGSTLLSSSNKSDLLAVYGINDDAYVRNPASGSFFLPLLKSADYKYSAFYGRLSYAYQNKYLLNGTIRSDGSSRFGPQKQFKNFGAIGAGWVFSEENFIKNNLSFLSFGKIRGSWGVTGIDQIGDYRYLDTYTFSSDVRGSLAIYQGIRPLSVTGLFNPNYGWERTSKVEYGLELGLFEDQIFISGSWYKNKSDNQLLTNQLPAYVGFPRVVGNLDANMDNVGQEYTLSFKSISSKKINWQTSFNISSQRNRVLHYNSITGTYANTLFERIAKERKSINSVQLTKVTSLNPNDGTFMFNDSEGNPGPASSADVYAILIDRSPAFFGGMQNNLKYGDFQFSISLQFVKQVGVSGIYGPEGILTMPGTMNNQDRYVLNRWQKPGDVSDIRKFSQNIDDFLGVLDFDRLIISDQNYSDASFIRCNNLSISWGFPDHILHKIGVKKIRIHLQGQNLFTITKYKGWDPETLSTTSIPALRVFTTGLEVSF